MSFTANIDEIIAENHNRLLGIRPSWKRVRLKEVATILNGFPFESAKFKKDHGMPLLRIRDVVRGETETFYDGEYDPAFLVKPGDLVVGMDGDFNSARWRSEPALLNQRVCKITVDPSRYSTRFLEYVLPGYLAAINAHTPSVTVKHLSSRTVADIPLPFPPLDDQERIVAEIEKQFTRLNAGVASLKRVQTALKRYRASVLKAACEGRLVPKGSDWKHVPLKELIGRIGQGWSPKCDLTREASPDEWAIVTTTAVQSMRYVDNQGKPLPSELAPRPNLEIKVGDFLITRKGPRKRAGVTCLVRSTRPKLMLCDTVYRFRCDESFVVPDYLELALNSPSVVREIDRQKAGINESGVSLTHGRLGVVSIPVPTIPEQMLIVAEVQRRLSVIDEIDTVLRTSEHRAMRLRQSILGKMFGSE